MPSPTGPSSVVHSNSLATVAVSTGARSVAAPTGPKPNGLYVVVGADLDHDLSEDDEDQGGIYHGNCN